MEKRTKIIIGVSALALLIGVGIFFYRKKGGGADGKSKDDFGDGDFDYDMGDSSDSRYTSPVAPRLNFIQNKNVASYLSQKLNDKQQSSLRGWVDLIKEDKAKNPSKWGDSSGLTGEKAIIGHALYQMQKSGNCPECWSIEVAQDLQDA